MKQLFAIISLISCLSANATTYYFSTTDGNDTRTAAQAQSSSTPWKTMSQANTMFSNGTILIGDILLFERGEKFFGTFTITKNTITIDAYGIGNDPIFTSEYLIPSWPLSTGITNVYGATIPTILNTCKMVTKNNGEPLMMGRYPDFNTTNGGFLNSVAGGFSGTGVSGDISTLTSDASLGTIPWATPTITGNAPTAKICVRSTHWTLDPDIITAVNTTTHVISYQATYSSTVYTNSAKGEPLGDFFILDDLRTVTTNDEHYFNPNTDALYYYSNSGAPSGIRCATLTNAIVMSGRTGITISNIDFQYYNGDAISITNGSTVTVSNCSIKWSGKSGIYNNGSTFLTVTNCNIVNSLTNGIDNNVGTNLTVLNTGIHNTGVWPGMGEGGVGKTCGVISRSENALVQYCSITNVGYCGLWSKNFGNLQFKNNLIDSFCRFTDDGAAIYIVGLGVNALEILPTRYVWDNVIRGHALATSIFGSNGTLSSMHGGYCDNSAGQISWLRNRFDSIGRSAIFFHGASRDVYVSYNTFYHCGLLMVGDARACLIYVNDDKDSVMKRNVLTNNIVVSSSTSIRLLYIDNILSTYPSWTRIDSNHYYYLTGHTAPFSTELSGSRTDRLFSKSGTGWRQLSFAPDVHGDTTIISNTIKGYFSTGESGRTVTELAGFNWTDAEGNSYPGTDYLAPFQAKFYIKGSAITTPPPSGSTGIPIRRRRIAIGRP